MLCFVDYSAADGLVSWFLFVVISLLLAYQKELFRFFRSYMATSEKSYKDKKIVATKEFKESSSEAPTEDTEGSAQNGNILIERSRGLFKSSNVSGRHKKSRKKVTMGNVTDITWARNTPNDTSTKRTAKNDAHDNQRFDSVSAGTGSGSSFSVGSVSSQTPSTIDCNLSSTTPQHALHFSGNVSLSLDDAVQDTQSFPLAKISSSKLHNTASTDYTSSLSDCIYSTAPHNSAGNLDHASFSFNNVSSSTTCPRFERSEQEPSPNTSSSQISPVVPQSIALRLKKQLQRRRHVTTADQEISSAPGRCWSTNLFAESTIAHLAWATLAPLPPPQHKRSLSRTHGESPAKIASCLNS